MKTKLALVAILAAVAVTTVVWTQRTAFSHCEIPCGIYGDKTRVDLLHEHIRTVEKSMAQIRELSGKNDGQSVNQTVRWVTNKDKHADEIQHIVTQYFMTQRVKAKPTGTPEHLKYMTQLQSLHGMLVSAMKSKQTVDTQHTVAMREHLDKFVGAYFTGEDLKHIREHHKKQ